MRLTNGSRCIAVPGKPDTVRGMSANVWLDEFAFFEDPDATWKAILPSITSPLRGGEKRVILTSTPNGKAGRGKRFFDICNAEKADLRGAIYDLPIMASLRSREKAKPKQPLPPALWALPPQRATASRTL